MAIPSVVFTWTIADPADKSRPAALEASGWTSVVNKPSRQHMNWMFENIAQWITYFNAEAIPAAADAYLPDFLEQHNADGTHSTVTTSGSLTVGTDLIVTDDIEVGGNVVIDGEIYAALDSGVGGTFSAVADITIVQNANTSSITMGGTNTSITGDFYKSIVLYCENNFPGLPGYPVLLSDTSGDWAITRCSAFLDTVTDLQTSLPNCLRSDIGIFLNYGIGNNTIKKGTCMQHLKHTGNVAADRDPGPPTGYTATKTGCLIYLQYGSTTLNEVLNVDIFGSDTELILPFRIFEPDASGYASATAAGQFLQDPHFGFFYGCRLAIYRNYDAQTSIPIFSTHLNAYPGSSSAYLSVDAVDDTVGYITIPYADLSGLGLHPSTSFTLIIHAQVGDFIGDSSFTSDVSGTNYGLIYVFYPAILKNMRSGGIGQAI